MSEEIKPKAFVFNADSKPVAAVELEFADGRHVVPEWVVAHLGGVDKVTAPESVAVAARLTFEEFMRAFYHTVAHATLSNFGKQIVRDHLTGLARARPRETWEG